MLVVYLLACFSAIGLQLYLLGTNYFQVAYILLILLFLLFAVLESEQAIGDVLCPYQTTELTAFISIIIVQACLDFV